VVITSNHYQYGRDTPHWPVRQEFLAGSHGILADSEIFSENFNSSQLSHFWMTTDRPISHNWHGAPLSPSTPGRASNWAVYHRWIIG
jgi:hypothetical protein